MTATETNQERQLKHPEIQIKRFDDLTPRQVANLYALRYNVFVKEQESIFDEHDGHDFDAIHLFIEDQDQIVAYARVYRKDAFNATIGRVAVAKNFRGQDLGRKIVDQAINAAKNLTGIDKIDLSSQQYLKKFYEDFSFKQVEGSEPYDDAGVMHVDMHLPVTPPAS